MGVARRVGTECRGVHVGQGRRHPDQRGAGSQHDRIAEESVLAGDQQLLRMIAHQRRNSLKRHYGIQRRHFDAEHSGNGKNPVERGVIIGHAACGFVEIEGDDRELARQVGVKGHGIIVTGERQQRIRSASRRFTGHLEAVRARDDHFMRERRAPALENQTAL